MASLLSAYKVGNSSPSSLVKSANTLSNEIATYNDTAAKITYENSAKTDEDLATYQNYLQGRITQLQGTGSVTNQTKALNMQQEITTAIHGNISANIQRENIDLMAGNATLTDKYNIIVGQYQRATAIGDMSLAQTLESQAYSVSQSIQLQAQTAADAQATLAKASATTQGEIVTNLKSSVDQLNTDIKNLGAKDFNKTISKWVDTNRATLQSLGVVIPKGAQPNYFDVVNGVMGAMYNHNVLAAQAYATVDPQKSLQYQNDATALLNNQTTIKTLGGDLTAQQVQEAAQNPSMFAYDSGNGKYILTKQTGFQYDNNGQIEPTYSGSVKQTIFLNAQQTSQMTKLGLNFTENTTGKNAGTTGNGVQVQLTANSPAWLKSVLGENGVTNMFFNQQTGFLEFAGNASSGNGRSYYILGTDNGGHNGLFEQTNDGKSIPVGGEYGFKASSVNELINSALYNKLAVQNATPTASLTAPKVPQIPNITVQKPAPTPTLKVAAAPSTQSVSQQAAGAKTTQNAAGAPAVQNAGGGGKALQGGGGALSLQ